MERGIERAVLLCATAVVLLIALVAPATADNGVAGLPVRAVPGSSAESVPASFGMLYNGTLSEVAEQDAYSISAEAGDTLFIRLIMKNWDGPVIVVYRPDGTVLAWAKSAEGGYPDIQGSQLTVTIPASGVYQVTVSDYWREASDIQYSLYLQRTGNPGRAVPLGVSEGVAASLDQVECDTYTITPAGDTSVTILVESDAVGDKRIWLYHPNGTLLKTETARYYWGWDSSVTMYATVPETGRYTVLVGSYRGQSAGPYSVTTYYTAGSIPAVAPVPPSILEPTDTNDDGKYDDVNGNGRPDFADVVLFFNQLTWIAANEPLAAFDYNANGRIDFADVVWLFNNL